MRRRRRDPIAAQRGLIGFGGTGRYFVAEGTLAVAAVHRQPVPVTNTYPACWQAWRLAVAPSEKSQSVEPKITTYHPVELQLNCRVYFIPHNCKPQEDLRWHRALMLCCGKQAFHYLL
jgi:hypothetical protein